MALELVIIKWDDASALEHGWTAPEDEKPVAQIVTTVGFLVAQTADHVVIAHTSDGNFVNGKFQIPVKMIRTLKPLRPKRKPKQVTSA